MIETEKGRELADSYGLEFFEASAKTGENVPVIFDNLAK